MTDRSSASDRGGGRQEGWDAELKDLLRRKDRTRTHKRLRARLLMVLFVTIALDLVLTVLSFLSAGGDIGGRWPSALGWTTSQLLTGGSSYQVESGWGHLIEVVAQMYSVTVVAALAGSFAAFFHGRQVERR